MEGRAVRARNVKPGLLHNEILGSADPLYTVVFVGLWMLADREGRLEDRPLRIHAQINPYRPCASTVQALDWLVQENFVLRYQFEGQSYLQVVNFSLHQQPHVREAPSKLPPPENASGIKHGVPSTRAAPGKHSASTGAARLIPSSLIPDSNIKNAGARANGAPRANTLPGGVVLTPADIRRLKPDVAPGEPRFPLKPPAKPEAPTEDPAHAQVP